jgi:hypothetical protein
VAISDPAASVRQRDQHPRMLEIQRGEQIPTPPADRARTLVDLVWRTVEGQPEPSRAVIEANWPDAIATLSGAPPRAEGAAR